MTRLSIVFTRPLFCDYAPQPRASGPFVGTLNKTFPPPLPAHSFEDHHRISGTCCAQVAAFDCGRTQGWQSPSRSIQVVGVISDVFHCGRRNLPVPSESSRREIRTCRCVVPLCRFPDALLPRARICQGPSKRHEQRSLKENE
jgi:hypothetical protein